MLVKLHDLFRDTILSKVEAKMTELYEMGKVYSTQFNELKCNNDEEYYMYVKKFEFGDYEETDRSNASMYQVKAKYPVMLPYTMFVVDVLNHLVEFINKNLDYWQFLLNEMSDFDLVTNSCNEILLTAGQFIFASIDDEVFVNPGQKYSLLQQAQIAKNFDYLTRGMGFFRKVVLQRLTYGLGKIAITTVGQ